MMKEKYTYAICAIGLLITSLNATQQNEAQQNESVQQQHNASIDVQSIAQEIRDLTTKVNILAYGLGCNAASADLQVNKGVDEQKKDVVKHPLNKQVTIVNSNVFIVGHK